MVVERSNSFISNIDWIVHGFGGSRPHAYLFVSFVSFSATFIAWTERPRSFRIRMCVYRIIVNGLRVNRLVFAHAREASINIYRHTHRHTHYRSAYTLQIHRHYRSGHTAIATLQRTGCFVLSGDHHLHHQLLI